MPHNSAYTLIYRDTQAHLALMYEEIATCLGRRGVTKVGLLCGDVDGNGTRVNKINKWAKYKPVRLENMWGVTDNMPNWWKADGMCGIDASGLIFDVFSSFVSRLLAAYNRNSQYYLNFLDWEYAPPRGYPTYREPFRPLDFNYYYSIAESPGGEVQTGRRDIANGQTSVLYALPTIAELAYNLQIGDFAFTIPGAGLDAGFNDCYFGVLLVSGTRTAWAAGTLADAGGNPVTIGNMSTGVNYQIPVFGAEVVLNGTAVDSDVDAIPFISTMPMGEDDFPNGVTSANIDTIESEGDPDTGALLEGAWLSAFGNEPVVVTLHRFGQYAFALDSNVEWDGNWIKGDVILAVPGETGQVTVSGMFFGVCKDSDVALYRGGSLTKAQLQARAITAPYPYGGTFTGNVGTSFLLESLTANNQGINAPEGTGPDEYDPTHDYYLVAFPSNAQSLNAIISASVVSDIS